MNTLVAASLLAFASTSPPGKEPIGLNFSDTEVSQIFRALGSRTGANILYAGKEKKSISLRFTADGIEEAVRGVAASAGLSFRRVGNTYVVANPEGMKQALSPFSRRARVAAHDVADPEAYLAKILPDVTVIAATGTMVDLTGIPEDLEMAKELLSSLGAEARGAKEANARKGQLVTETLTIRLADPNGVVAVLKDLYPDVKVVSLASGGNGEKAETGGGKEGERSAGMKGGTLGFVGREADVRGAKAKAHELDAAVSSLTGELRMATYDIRFGTPRALIAFLASMAPEVQASIAPATYVPEGLNTGVGTTVGMRAITKSRGGGGTAGEEVNGFGQKPPEESSETGGAKTSIEIDPTADRAKRLVLKGHSADVEAALKLLAQVDVAPRQVEVEVRVVDVSPEFESKFGFKYSWSNLDFYELTPGYKFAPSVRDNMANGLRRPGAGSFARLPFNINAIFEARTVAQDVKILARPKIQVMENEEANFFIGDTVNYAAPTSGALGTQNVEVLTFNVGIALRVRPRVNADGNVTMHVNPIVSTISGFVNNLPQTASREATTTVMVKSGETLVLGGLVRDEERKTTTEVPILGRIPIIGQLFRHTERSRRQSNVVVTITPRIIDAAEGR